MPPTEPPQNQTPRAAADAAAAQPATSKQLPPTVGLSSKFGTKGIQHTPAERKQLAEDAAKKYSSKNKYTSTQKNLLVSEVRDGIVIMRDGSMRAVVICQSINFDLMSDQEKEGVLAGYQSFLNSLYFEDIQILVRSHRVNLNNYIEKLAQINKNQENILLGLLMNDYIEYIQYMVENSNIMDKQFYVVIPFYPPTTLSGAKRFGGIGGLLNKKNATITIEKEEYEKFKDGLKERTSVVIDGLNQMNIQAVALDTQELIELYYTFYNPVTAQTEKLVDVNTLEAPIVTKGEGSAPQTFLGDM